MKITVCIHCRRSFLSTYAKKKHKCGKAGHGFETPEDAAHAIQTRKEITSQIEDAQA